MFATVQGSAYTEVNINNNVNINHYYLSTTALINAVNAFIDIPYKRLQRVTALLLLRL